MVARWHILKGERELTLARHLPARFDVSAATTLPAGDPLRIAQQIRQDMWRRFQKVRGFSPVVRVTMLRSECHVEAGGRLLGPPPQQMEYQIEQLLTHPDHRSRWVVQARRGKTWNR
jgi:ribosomal protein S18 acetylase RimI-like enzyme